MGHTWEIVSASCIPALHYSIVTLASVCALCTAYQLLLNPIRRYPGPIVARLTDAYDGFHAFKGDLHLAAWRNHQQYGPVVRHGPKKLVFSSVAAIRDIYRNAQTTKPKAYIALGPGLNISTTFSASTHTYTGQDASWSAKQFPTALCACLSRP